MLSDEKLNKLTVFNKPEDSSVLQRDVHVEVLNIDIHLANSSLVLLTLFLEFLDHFL